MLNIFYGDMKEAVYNTASYFKYDYEEDCRFEERLCRFALFESCVRSRRRAGNGFALAFIYLRGGPVTVLRSAPFFSL